MALQICPDCGKEVSTSAEACPNCGHPFKQTPATEQVVHNTTSEQRSEVPKWLIFPVIALVGILIVLFIMLFRSTDDNANENVNIDIAAETQRQTTRDSSARTTDTPTGVAPPTTTDIPDSDNQQTVPADTQTQVEDSGKVELEAKVADKNGKVTPVEDEKFYLLDKDFESILREANLKSIENQTLTNSFGLSVLYPDRYGEFNEKALKAINDHVKYDVLTGSSGKAEISNVEPKSYYLFGIHKVGNGFAIWNYPVTIKAGQNKLNIQPQRMTEISR